MHIVDLSGTNFDGYFDRCKMPKVAAELGAVDIKRASHPGGQTNAMVAVGGVAGLYLQITPNGGKTWILRMRVGEKRRDFGLGGYPTITLALARERAREARGKVERGIDPVEERKEAKARLALAQRRGLSFDEAVERYLVAKLDAFRNAKHRQQWRNTLSSYALPHLGGMQVSDIDTRDVLRALEPIWADRTETASRVRGRIEAVLSWATVAGHRAGDNPARWAGNLKELLPAPSRIAETGNQPALSLDDAPLWFAALRQRGGFGARALEFLALTAARSGEVRGATWNEIDLGRGLWTIPAARMKMKREHRVPLPKSALDLLHALPRLDESPLVFQAARGGQLSDMTLSATMKRLHVEAMNAEAKSAVAVGHLLADGAGGFRDPRSKRPAVPHGLRSTFRDWVAERTSWPGEMAEVALAHRISSAVEAAYRRGDMVEKRRKLMEDWSGFLAGETIHENVYSLAGSSR